MKKVSLIFGTRPEAIKLCPLILAMKERPDIEPHVCVTSQHREMLAQVLEVFAVMPDVDLHLMEPGQTLASLTSKAVAAIDSYLSEHGPDLVIVQGDTTTVFCAALAAFYRQIPVGHVEAGLRTWNKLSPFPEEINRVLTTRLADLHFAPTRSAADNLISEGVEADKIFVTGNTVIDALHMTIDRAAQYPPEIPGLPAHLMNGGSETPLVLITGHRRENHGRGMINICKAVSVLAERFSHTEFVYPVHLNPNVSKPIYEMLSGLRNVHLIRPLGYLPFVVLMNRARLILTDSGGVQEEAPSLGKPVLVMRDTTERPEAVEMGTVKLVGTDTTNIVRHVSDLLTDSEAYDAMANVVNPYGDGKACDNIVGACCDYWATDENRRSTISSRVAPAGQRFSTIQHNIEKVESLC